MDALTVDALAGWIDASRIGRCLRSCTCTEPHAPYTPPPAHAMAQPYDGEIAYADELVGRFIDRLTARGLFDRVDRRRSCRITVKGSAITARRSTASCSIARRCTCR